MTNKERHEKAVRLCEGDTVWVSGLMVRAKRIPSGFCACQECEMDSACDYDMCAVCAECDAYEYHTHILCLPPRSTRMT